MVDERANWVSAVKIKRSNAPVPQICGTKTGALLLGEAFHFLIDFRSYFDIWGGILLKIEQICCVRNRAIFDTVGLHIYTSNCVLYPKRRVIAFRDLFIY